MQLRLCWPSFQVYRFCLEFYGGARLFDRRLWFGGCFLFSFFWQLSIFVLLISSHCLGSFEFVEFEGQTRISSKQRICLFPSFSSAECSSTGGGGSVQV